MHFIHYNNNNNNISYLDIENFTLDKDNAYVIDNYTNQSFSNFSLNQSYDMADWDRDYEHGDYTNMDILFHIYLYKVAAPILYACIIVIGLIGNVMVVSVIISKRKMRTTLNLLLLNLAAADLMFVSIGIPFVCYHYAADNWLIGETMCKLSQYIIYVCVYVTTSTLVSIAAVRFMTIVLPANSIRLRTKKNIVYIVGIIWIITLLVNIPILMIYKVKTFPLDITIEPYYYCGMTNKVMGQRVFIAFFIFTYLVPLVSITSFYFLITKYLYKAKAQAMRLKRGSTTTDALRTKSARMSYATRLLFIVCAVFGICWLPLHIHLLLSYFGIQPTTKSYEVFRIFCHCLAYSNSCMNPIVYNYASREFRKNFRDIWSRFFCCHCWCTKLLKKPLVSACEMRMIRHTTIDNGTVRSSPTVRNATTYVQPSFY